VTDVEQDGEKVTVFTPNNEYAKARTALVAALGEELDFDVDEIQFLPQTTSPVSGEEDTEMFERLMNMLNECDDVQNVWHNGELA